MAVIRLIRRHPWPSFVLMAGVALPLATLLVQQLSELGGRTIPCCDYAVLELGTRSFLLGEQLVRVDLKADRQAGVLRVLAAHDEPDTTPDTPARLAQELRLMAGWLGLSDVAVAAKGELAPALAAEIGAA